MSSHSCAVAHASHGSKLVACAHVALVCLPLPLAPAGGEDGTCAGVLGKAPQGIRQGPGSKGKNCIQCALEQSTTSWACLIVDCATVLAPSSVCGHMRVCMHALLSWRMRCVVDKCLRVSCFRLRLRRQRKPRRRQRPAQRYIGDRAMLGLHTATCHALDILEHGSQAVFIAHSYCRKSSLCLSSA